MFNQSHIHHKEITKEECVNRDTIGENIGKSYVKNR